MKSIFVSFDFRERLNSHIEERIGECCKNALAYRDTKRERDTVKYLLTQITSVRFMAKLQGTDIAATLENEFRKGDRIKRGGGGLESHPRLTNDIFYRAADNLTNMTDARLALLSLAPENFSISLSTCYNYT